MYNANSKTNLKGKARQQKEKAALKKRWERIL